MKKKQKKFTEQTACESEERYRILFDNMLNGLAYCKMLYHHGIPVDFIYREVNGAFETLTGLKDVVGKKVSEVIPAIRESDPELFEIYGRVAMTGVPERFETYVEALDMWFSVSVYSPEKEYFVALFDVITERKRAEEALRISYRLLQIALSQTDLAQLLLECIKEIKNYTGCAAVGIRILDEKGKIPYQAYDGFSRSFFELESPLSIHDDTCMCINVIKGTTDPKLPFYTEGGSFYMNGTTRFLATVSADEKGETRNVCNQVGYESVALVPIRFNDPILGLIHIADPRENMVPLRKVEALEKVGMQLGTTVLQMKAEDEVRKLNAELETRVRDRTAQLEAANRELEAFSYSVSHDLRAPLRAIDGFSKVLMDKYSVQLDNDAQRYLDIIRSNTQQMGRLIDDLLSFSRIGKQEMRLSRINMERLAREAFEQIQSQHPDRLIDFKVESPPPASGDTNMIKIALTNLLSNAVKFTGPRNEPIIEFGGSAENNENVYYVKDNGVGFDMKYAGKLFGVFQRLHGRDEFEGTGVGLALVQRIIIRHGGRVRAEGAVNEGAVFHFTLPIKGGGS